MHHPHRSCIVGRHTGSGDEGGNPQFPESRGCEGGPSRRKPAIAADVRRRPMESANRRIAVPMPHVKLHALSQGAESGYVSTYSMTAQEGTFLSPSHRHAPD